MPDEDQPPTSMKSIFKGGFRHHFKNIILHPELTPEQVALSFAIGFSLAWNPFIGLHTFLILVLCFIFKRLHRPLMFLACFINNPWTMVPMASLSGLVGNLLMGRGCRPKFHGIRWDTIGWHSFVSHRGFDHMYLMLKPILGPYLLGGMVMSALALPVGYYVMLKLARHLRKLHIKLPPVKLPAIHFTKTHPDKPE
jgi:uncharacterized protein (DUF2062 family)